MEMIRIWGACFVATVAFCVLFHAPKKAVLLSAAIGVVAYAVYGMLRPRTGDTLGYFVAACLIGGAAECCARALRMPATIFICASVIPLGPGLGLYRTMLSLVEGDLSAAGRLGADTLLALGAIALAIAVTSLVARLIFSRKKFKKKRGIPHAS